MSVNIELLDKALKIIQEHPDNWNQSKWHCGTSHCLAGHVQLILHELPYDTDCDELPYVKTFDIAQEALGISEKDAFILFRSANSLETLLHYRNILASEGSLENRYDRVA